ncbi:hypothetical protein [Flavobacterium sp. AG291]|uniref:hypothetical protein n=1 Tax=Flavobacterium sp. AG291 TaxID=2184000 RepID=UPI000E2C111C|nr:hypothetical protein [Flavobacterium sp. AG291]RDI05384.1 hypothetical protein DEU42_11857 [Flavobacterium sp. AG291]
MDSNIIGYDINNNPITDHDLIEDINMALIQIDKGTLETYTPEEVRQRIVSSNNSKIN